MSGEFLVISGEGQAYSEAEAEEWFHKPDGENSSVSRWLD